MECREVGLTVDRREENGAGTEEVTIVIFLGGRRVEGLGRQEEGGGRRMEQGLKT